MQVTDTQHKEYPILSLCIEDFEHEVECRKEDCLADEEWTKDGEDDLATAKSLTPEEWSYLAELITDYLWTENFSEVWRDARTYAIERIRKLRLGTDGPL